MSAQECGWIRRRSRPQLSPDRSRRPRPPNRRRHRLGCLLVGAAASTGTTLGPPVDVGRQRQGDRHSGTRSSWKHQLQHHLSPHWTPVNSLASLPPSSAICRDTTPSHPSPSLAASAWPQKHEPIHDVSSRRRAAATVIDRHRHHHPSQSPGRLLQRSVPLGMATVAGEEPPRSSIEKKAAVVMAAGVDDDDPPPAFERLPDEIIQQYAVSHPASLAPLPLHSDHGLVGSFSRPTRMASRRSRSSTRNGGASPSSPTFTPTTSPTARRTP